MKTSPSHSMEFLLLFAPTALIVALLAGSLSDTLSDDDRQAIARMLDGATPLLDTQDNVQAGESLSR